MNARVNQIQIHHPSNSKKKRKKTTCEIVKNDPSYQYSNICGYTILQKKNIYDFSDIRVSDIVQKKDYDYDDTNNNNNNNNNIDKINHYY